MSVADISRSVPRLSLNRTEVALATGFSPNTIDRMVEEGYLPKPRTWHSRKVWLVHEIIAAMSEWPDGGPMQSREDAGDDDDWRAS